MKKIIYLLILALMPMSMFAADRKIAVSSYPWKKTTVAAMLEDLKKIGVGDVAMFPGMKLGGNGDMKDAVFSHRMNVAERAAAKKIFDDAGVRIVAYSHMNSSKEADIANIYSFAQFFKIASMTVEAPRAALPIYDKYSASTKIESGLYNHPKGRAPYPDPESMLEAVKDLKNIKTFPDIGHWGRSKFNVVECVKKLKGEIYHINIQDINEQGACVKYGSGLLPIKDVVAELDRRGFDGFYIVMFDVSPTPLDNVAPSVEYLRSIKKSK